MCHKFSVHMNVQARQLQARKLCRGWPLRSWLDLHGVAPRYSMMCRNPVCTSTGRQGNCRAGNCAEAGFGYPGGGGTWKVHIPHSGLVLMRCMTRHMTSSNGCAGKAAAGPEAVQRLALDTLAEPAWTDPQILAW